MRAITGCVLGLLLSSGLAADDKKGEKIDAKKLIGTWEPKDRKEGRSAVVEFAKGGKATATVSPNGKEMTFDGTYKIDGDTLTLTLKLPGKEVTQTHTV